MKMNRKLVIIAALALTMFVSVAAIEPTPPKEVYTNLKILPKDISTKALQKIMVDEFQDGMGVGCNFCHAREKGALTLDYASDEKPEKEIARVMMSMTMDINEKYFQVEHPLLGDSLMVISCESCHHGSARPERVN